MRRFRASRAQRHVRMAAALPICGKVGRGYWGFNHSRMVAGRLPGAIL